MEPALSVTAVALLDPTTLSLSVVGSSGSCVAPSSNIRPFLAFSSAGAQGDGGSFRRVSDGRAVWSFNDAWVNEDYLTFGGDGLGPFDEPHVDFRLECY